MALDPAWLASLRERLDAPPTTLRPPLVLAVSGAPPATIGSIESTLALELAAASLPLRDASDDWRIELPHALTVAPTFAGIAHTLRALGRAPAWRDELLDVGDESGLPVGAIERAAVRPLGIATKAVHLVVSDARGNVWVQQRAFDKATDPGLWDTTMGGLSSAGESSSQTLERESWEEAGLRLAQLTGIKGFGRLTVRRPVADGYMVEHIEMVEAVATEGVVPVNQDGEVECFQCLDRAALVERLHADAFTLEAAMVLVHWLERPRTANL